MNGRVVLICAVAIVVAIVAALIAQVLVALIALITNISFRGWFSTAQVAPTTEKLGWFVIAIPVIGGVIVGLMARYGSQAIRGHGIPEAMEQVLLNESRIPARLDVSQAAQRRDGDWNRWTVRRRGTDHRDRRRAGIAGRAAHAHDRR